MKKFKYLVAGLIAVTTLSISSCKKEDSSNSNTNSDKKGSMAVRFDNVVGDRDMELDSAGSAHYHYSTGKGQSFGLSLFGYYISKVKLTGPNGELYEDEMNVSANPDLVKGYYHVLESDISSQLINLEDVPEGIYNKISFTIGIDESGVQQGAAGGVLDPANGAWFWNWNAGYIGFAIEGNAADSPQKHVDWGGGFVTHEKTFAVHVGGWKDIPADSTGVQKFVNNVRTLTLNFDSPLNVGNDLTPRVHIEVDALNLINASGLDFISTYAVHSPGAGKFMADKLQIAFGIDHVHQ